MTSRKAVSTLLIKVGVVVLWILTDTGQLSEELDQCAQEQTPAILFDLEHDTPARGSYRFLRRQRSSDLVILRLDPFVVGAVVMQFSQDLHPLVVTVFLDQVPWTLRQPNQSYEQEDGWYDLEAQREAPLKGTRVGGVPGSVSHPSRYYKANTYHLLSCIN
jgi:hypothetical protein